jgi:hypothetical protein
MRENDLTSLEALEEKLVISHNFSAMSEVIMLIIEKWFVQTHAFSAIIDSSSVFERVAEYVIESERGISLGSASLIYTPRENVTVVEFGAASEEVKLSLLYRASEHGFRAREFHRLCDKKGPTITLVKAEGGQVTAFYNGGSWNLCYYGLNRVSNTRGFIASIAKDPETSAVYSLQKYVPNQHATAVSNQWWGPSFDGQLWLPDRCNEVGGSSSLEPFAGYKGGYTREGMAGPMTPLFGIQRFRVSDYEVFQVELVDTV